MALPDTYIKFTLVLSSPQKFKFYNVFYYTPVAAPTFTGNPMSDSLTMGGAIYTQLTTGIAPCLTINTQVVGGNCELLHAGQSYDTSAVNLVPGTIDGDELADFEAIVIQKRTAVAGKSGRGRWYLGPVPEQATDENFLLTAAYPDYDNLMQAWCADVTELGTAWHSCLFSKKNLTLSPITSGYVDYKIGSIRGRKSTSILT